MLVMEDALFASRGIRQSVRTKIKVHAKFVRPVLAFCVIDLHLVSRIHPSNKDGEEARAMEENEFRKCVYCIDLCSFI